jgi:uncharacterized protein YegP (UPF0339 family)
MAADGRPAAQFRIYRTSAGAIVWRLVAFNNRALGSSVSDFDSLAGALMAVREVRERVSVATIGLVHVPGRDWVWRMVGDNGTPAAESSRSYKRRIDCLRSIDRFRLAAPRAAIDSSVGRRGRFWSTDRD